MERTDSRASEFKYVVTPALAEQIREWARARLLPDPHGTGAFGDEYDTTSVYFDTRTRDVLNRRGSYGRAKYRIRRYAAGEAVFLERKLRRRNRLAKRRTMVPIDELARLGEPVPQDWAGRWFARRVTARALMPVCQVSYHRVARGIAAENGPARLTMDDVLFARRIRQVGFHADPGVRIFDGHIILELKFRQTLPVVFKELVAEFGLTPGVASKYRLSMAAVEPAQAADAAAGLVPAVPEAHA